MYAVHTIVFFHCAGKVSLLPLFKDLDAVFDKHTFTLPLNALLELIVTQIFCIVAIDWA